MQYLTESLGPLGTGALTPRHQLREDGHFVSWRPVVGAVPAGTKTLLSLSLLWRGVAAPAPAPAVIPSRPGPEETTPPGRRHPAWAWPAPHVAPCPASAWGRCRGPLAAAPRAFVGAWRCCGARSGAMPCPAAAPPRRVPRATYHLWMPSWGARGPPLSIK